METMEKISGDKKQLTFGMVTAGINLSKLQVRAIFTTILKKSMPASEQVADLSDVFCLLVADLLENLACLRPEQRSLIVAELQPQLTAPPECPKYLVFADSRYCTWSGQTGYLDLETGDRVEVPAAPVMESIGYNLNELYRRGVQLLENRNGFHAKKSAAGSVDESGNICQRAPDAIS
jgi:hypothetical protein